MRKLSSLVFVLLWSIGCSPPSTIPYVLDSPSKRVSVSQQFMDEALPYKLLGMNQEMMNDYIAYIGDRLLLSLGYPKKYHKTNPFKFMDTIGLTSKANFFEERPTEYQDAHIFNTERDNNYYDFTNDF